MEKIGENAKIKKIAVTGSLSAGKSTVCEELKAHGAYVINADDIVHNLLSHDEQLIQQIKEKFSENVFLHNKIDRNLIAKEAFENPDKLKTLESIVHPKVVSAIKETYLQIKMSPYKAFVVEFPLLFEIQFDSFFDQIIYVLADREIRKKRFRKGQFENREKRFINEEDKIAKSQIIIENNGSLKNLNNQLKNIL